MVVIQIWHSVFPLRLQRKAAGFLAVDGEGEQRTFVYCCEVSGLIVLRSVVLFDHLQRFLKLQHSGEFVLAVVAAEARTYQPTDLAVAVFELHLVGFAALYDCIALSGIDT